MSYTPLILPLNLSAFSSRRPQGYAVRTKRGYWFKTECSPVYNQSSFDSGDFTERSVAFTVGKDFVNTNGNLLGVALSYERSFIRSPDTGVRGSSDNFSLSGYGSRIFGR